MDPMVTEHLFSYKRTPAARLGRDRFEEVFGAGFRLSQRDTVAEVRAHSGAGRRGT
jgi:hypothetical protein